MQNVQPVFPPADDPIDGSPLWQLWRGGQLSECEVVRTPVGFEGQCLFNGRLLVSYQFSRLEQACEWAAQRWAEMQTQGWTRRAA